MPPPVENIPAQAQPQDLQNANIGHYDMAHDYPPPQGHLGDNARYIRDVPAQAYAARPAPVCIDLTLHRIHIFNHTLHHLQSRSTHLTAKFSRPQQAPLQPSSMGCLTRSLSPMGGSAALGSFNKSQFSTCTTAIHKLLELVGNLAKPMERRWSLPSDRLGCHILDCSEGLTMFF
jgi:hypothetical protein